MHGPSVRVVRETQQRQTTVAEEGSGTTEHSKQTSDSPQSVHTYNIFARGLFSDLVNLNFCDLIFTIRRFVK